MARESRRSWMARNATGTKTLVRVVFGVIWLIDGVLKFEPGLPAAFPAMIQEAAQGQPAWLAPWFSMWYSAVLPNPAFWVYLTGVFEVALGVALVLGLLRKIAYAGGILLSLFIWAVPEGFGGPYGPGSTDIGTGIIYCFVFLCLMVINATFGPSSLSLDRVIEKKVKFWARLAEFGA
ncbi:MAG: DoxX family membrane protein [Nitrososphaerota archaeon]|nr:DoxX family membrane protein [Nitrososphaerota archaeon]